MVSYSPELQVISDPRRIPAGIVLDSLIDTDVQQAGLMHRVEMGEQLVVPSPLAREGKPIIVPSLIVESPRYHKEARLVSLEGSDPNLQELFTNAAGENGVRRERIENMTFEMLARLMDSDGHSGLHHLHDTLYPHTIYHNAKRGNGILLNVFITEVGRMTGDNGSIIPVYGRLTATRDKRSEYQAFNLFGAGKQKAKKRP